jgi:hypothetical protein
LNNIEDNLQFFRDNYGENKLFPGGPMCEYNGKKVPCMIRYTKGGGISPEILTDILRTIDTLGVFEKEREEGIKPFLLLDGHQSRFSVEFLEYITDRQHPWKVCIGVPYGTALWQVGDSMQQNGKYKMSTSIKKKLILRKRISQMISDLEILPSDVIPIVNHAWNDSFANISGNRVAICERGWYPLNKNLLLLDELRQTMTADDINWENNSGLYPHNRKNRESRNYTQDSNVPSMRNQLNLSDENATTSTSHNLNITQGVAGAAIEYLVGQRDQQSIRTEASKKRKAGTTLREGFAKIKNLKASGQMIALTGTYEIGINTLEEVNRRAAINESVKEEEARVKHETYMMHLTNLRDLRLQKPDENKWTKAQILLALRAVKKQGDRANPSKCGDLLAYWNELRSRVPVEVVLEQQSEGESSVMPITVQTVEDSLDVKVEVNEKASTAM